MQNERKKIIFMDENNSCYTNNYLSSYYVMKSF